MIMKTFCGFRRLFSFILQNIERTTEASVQLFITHFLLFKIMNGKFYSRKRFDNFFSLKCIEDTRAFITALYVLLFVATDDLYFTLVSLYMLELSSLSEICAEFLSYVIRVGFPTENQSSKYKAKEKFQSLKFLLISAVLFLIIIKGLQIVNSNTLL